MTVGSTGARRRKGMGAGWFATLMAVLVAFSWQSFVTQTHQHYSPGTASSVAPATADGADPSRPDRQSPGDLPANCAICREIAHAGPVMLPAPIVLDAPAPATAWRAVTGLLEETLVQRSHAWQSRAPPFQLQG